VSLRHKWTGGGRIRNADGSRQKDIDCCCDETDPPDPGSPFPCINLSDQTLNVRVTVKYAEPGWSANVFDDCSDCEGVGGIVIFTAPPLIIPANNGVQYIYSIVEGCITWRLVVNCPPLTQFTTFMFADIFNIAPPPNDFRRGSATWESPLSIAPELFLDVPLVLNGTSNGGGACNSPGGIPGDSFATFSVA